jgi:hypothetical protein
MRLFPVTVVLLWATSSVSAAHLTQSAADEFSHYTSDLEARLSRQHADTCLGQSAPGTTRNLNGALLHHWRAAAFVPRATPQAMLNLLKDYSHFSTFYAPQVVSAHALTGDGTNATVAMRLQEKKVVTVVLDTEYQVETRLNANGCGYSLSRSTYIRQVDDPGTRHEYHRAEADDDGFLWRLNS